MTDPTVIHRFADNHAVTGVPDDGAAGGEVGDGAATPNLAAIQHSYEQAKANIVDPSPDWPLDDEPLPATEKLDVRSAKLPAVPAGTRGTAAMTVAARCLSEQPVVDELRSAPTRSAQPDAASAASPGPRGWWRGIRSALHGALPVRRPEV